MFVPVLRNTYIKRGLIRPCVPTPLVKDSVSGQWIVKPQAYER